MSGRDLAASATAVRAAVLSPSASKRTSERSWHPKLVSRRESAREAIRSRSVGEAALASSCRRTSGSFFDVSLRISRISFRMSESESGRSHLTRSLTNGKMMGMRPVRSFTW